MSLVDEVVYKVTYNALVGFYQALREEFKPSEGRLSVLILGKSIQFINLLENGYLNSENFLRYSIVTST